MTSKRILIQNGCVLTLDKSVGNFHRADVLIEGTKIAAIGPSLSAATTDAELIDAADMIVMPGFVDTHRHVWEASFAISVLISRWKAIRVISQPF